MGDRLEERKDFSVEVSAKVPEAKKLAQVRVSPRKARVGANSGERM